MNERWNEWLLTVCRSTHDGWVQQPGCESSSAAGITERPPVNSLCSPPYFRFLLLRLIKREEEEGGAFPAPPGRRADYSRWTTPPCVKAGIKSKLTKLPSSSSTTSSFLSSASSRLQPRRQRCAGSAQGRPSHPGPSGRSMRGRAPWCWGWNAEGRRLSSLWGAPHSELSKRRSHRAGRTPAKVQERRSVARFGTTCR